MKAISLTIDTVRCLAILFRNGERYNEYHVRAIYNDGNDGNTSVWVGSHHVPESIDNEMTSSGDKLTGFAVYGCAPEGMFVCGDELSFNTCATIAWVLNRIYSDNTITT